MEKHLVVKVAGAGEPQEITIHPGTTTKDVLETLGLGQRLMLTQDPAGDPFGLDESIWNKVQDGQKIFAVPPMQVGQ